MAKHPKWTVSIKIGGRTWTWREDTREAASERATKIATVGCTITVGKCGGFDRVGPGMISRIRVMPPRGVLANPAHVIGTMSIV